MLTARRASSWRGTYDIAVDGRPLTTWTPRVRRAGGDFALDGRSYSLRGRGWGSDYALTTGDVLVARADRVGRRTWSLTAGERVHTFRRASFWTGEQHLVEGGTVVGGVRRVGRWRADVEADLPGLELPVQVFALTVVLTLWAAQASGAAAAPT